MTERKGNVLIISEETDKTMCEYCGKVAETRPYGRNNEEICFDCGMKPGNIKVTQTKFKDNYS